MTPRNIMIGKSSGFCLDEEIILGQLPGALVVCPVCSLETVHCGTPTSQVVDDYSAWEGRGGVVKIPMYCEAGDTWDLRFGFHKGYTVMMVENIGRRDTTFDDDEYEDE